MAIVINTVYEIKETPTPNVLEVYLNITEDENNTYDTGYVFNPEDPYGAELHAAIAAWIDANPEFPITPYVPPTPDEIRQNMPKLTRRQLRLGLIDLGVTPSEAQTIIDGKPAGVEKEKANVEWNDGERFGRLHALVLEVATAFNITPEELDTMWNDNSDI